MDSSNKDQVAETLMLEPATRYSLLALVYTQHEAGYVCLRESQCIVRAYLSAR